MPTSQLYFQRLAAAFVRGRQSQGADVGLVGELARGDLDLLTADELESVLCQGAKAGLRLHKFKRTMELPRVQRVFGILRSLAPGRILDLGSGRGVFLWPLLDAFPDLSVIAVDRDPTRTRDIQAVRLGGINRLSCLRMDAARLAFGDGVFPVVTMLEVLEHTADPQAALDELVRVAGRFAILSVPSREDNNPEHLHLFNQQTLDRMFARAGAARVRFDYVPGHLIAIAGVSGR
jgi:ubiquinone/menaquinone biosynthesis C-methylase UbiE